MNQKKAKALRKAAREAASQFPIHATQTYQNIVREYVERRVVPIKADGLLKTLGKWLRGKKRVPASKRTVEVVTKRSIQTVLASGVRFILQRLKAGVRRGDIVVIRMGKQNYAIGSPS